MKTKTKTKTKKKPKTSPATDISTVRAERFVNALDPRALLEMLCWFGLTVVTARLPPPPITDEVAKRRRGKALAKAHPDDRTILIAKDTSQALSRWTTENVGRRPSKDRMVVLGIFAQLAVAIEDGAVALQRGTLDNPRSKKLRELRTFAISFVGWTFAAGAAIGPDIRRWRQKAVRRAAGARKLSK